MSRLGQPVVTGKQISGCRQLWKGEMTVIGIGFFWGDENVMKLDSGNGGTTL